MHFRAVLNVLGNLLLLLAAAMLLPLAFALLVDNSGVPLERYEVLSFVSAIAIAAVIGLALRSVFSVDLKHVRNREGAAIVTLTWVLFSLIGCLPYLLTGATGFTDAFFETMSGFTTTGATILPQVEVLPHGLQLWRHQTQWMGGMGIVVLSVAILPLLGIGGYRMFKAEAPGGSTFERNAPRIKEIAKVLWITYLVLSGTELLLLIAGGMTGYEALCHSFTTMSTGGFSTSSQSIAHWPSPLVQWTIIAFMMIAGANFEVYQKLIKGPRRQVLDDTELRGFLAIFFVAVAIHLVVLVTSGTGPEGSEPKVRASAFAVATISTTTGYGTEDFDRWPDMLRLTLVSLMIIGGCAGSTAGGMKVTRLVIFAKEALNELHRSISPHAVLVVRVGGRSIDRQVVANVMGFLVLYLGIMALASLVLSFMGLDMLTASTAAISCIGNVGPGLGGVGPTSNYAHLPLLAKWLLSACMLLGRLEVYSPLILLLKPTWTR